MTSAHTDPRLAEQAAHAGRPAAVTREVSTARIQPGPGYVARLGNVVVWAEPAPGPSGLDAMDALVSGLGDIAAHALPEAQATNQVGALLADVRIVALAGLAAVLPTASSLVAVAHGWGAVSGGNDVTAPPDSPSPTVRIIELVDEVLVVGRRDIAADLASNPDTTRLPGDRMAPSSRGLVEGVVPGGGAILGTRITISGSASEPVGSTTYHPPRESATTTTYYPHSEPAPGATTYAPPGPAPAQPQTQGAAAAHAQPQATGAPAAQISAAPPPPPPPPPNAAPGPGVTAEPPFAAGLTDDGARRGPLAPVMPAGAHPPPPASGSPDAAATGVRVEGIRCIRGHLNNPIWLHCGTCGVSLIKQSSDSEEGIRPPLGRIVFDDGSEFPVDGNFILGGAPERADTVQRGEARGLRVIDAVDGIEPVHTEIRVDEWDVSVIDWSTRGTYLLPEDTDGWQIPPKGVPSPLSPGTHIAIGGRTLIFMPNPTANP